MKGIVTVLDAPADKMAVALPVSSFEQEILAIAGDPSWKPTSKPTDVAALPLFVIVTLAVPAEPGVPFGTVKVVMPKSACAAAAAVSTKVAIPVSPAESVTVSRRV